MIMTTLLLVMIGGVLLPVQTASSGPPPVKHLNLTLVSNSPLNCGTGLTHPGVFVLVEYRLVKVEGQTVGEWQLLDTVRVSNEKIECQRKQVPLLWYTQLCCSCANHSKKSGHAPLFSRKTMKQIGISVFES